MINALLLSGVPAQTLWGVDVLGALVADVVLQGGRHNLISGGKRMDSIIAPLGAYLFRFIILEGRAETKHPIGAENPEVTDSARVKRVPYVLPQTEDIGAKSWQIRRRRIVRMMRRITATGLEPVTSEGGQEDFLGLSHRLDCRGQRFSSIQLL